MNLYEPSVGVFGRGLNGLSTLRHKAVEFADENDIDETDILNRRLYPDMFPLYRQFQIVCDFARQTPARIVGLPVPESFSGEPGFDEVSVIIGEAKEYVASFDSECFAGREELPVTFPVGESEMTLSATQYLFGFSTQNYFFHLVTAYGILRSIGVVLGKRAYFGQDD